MVGDILQPTHLLLILVVALLVLGPKRLPEAGRALGTGLRDFKMALSGEKPDSQAEPVGHASVPATGNISPRVPDVASPTPVDRPATAAASSVDSTEPHQPLS